MVDGEVIPTYPHPEIPPRIISQAVIYDDWRRQPAGQSPRYSEVDLSKIKAICAKAVSERGSGWLDTEETYTVLAAMMLPIVQGAVAVSAEEAVKLAYKMGLPVAVKLASHKIVHKTEIGALVTVADIDDAGAEAEGHEVRGVGNEKARGGFHASRSK